MYHIYQEEQWLIDCSLFFVFILKKAIINTSDHMRDVGKFRGKNKRKIEKLHEEFHPVGELPIQRNILLTEQEKIISILIIAPERCRLMNGDKKPMVTLTQTMADRKSVV